MDVFSACLMAHVMGWEGLRLKAYWDQSAWAICYGHHGDGVHRGLVVPVSGCLQWLHLDWDKAGRCVVRQTKGMALTAGERAALTDFCYNLGELRLQNSLLMRKFRRGDLPGAAAEFDRWVVSSGHIHPGLVVRRATEKAWFQNKGCRP